MAKLKNSKTNNGFLYTPAGFPFMPQLKRQVNEKTKEDEIVVGVNIDLQEEMQNSSNSYDLALLKEKYKKTGEIPPDLGGYGDTDIDLTMYPDNIHDLYKVRNRLEDYFNKLDGDLRDSYGDFSQFVKSVYNGVVSEKTKRYYQNLENKNKLEALEKAKEGEING